jgi:hypothetical protein
MLPKKRQLSRSNILRVPERVYQRHRKWLRSHECVCTLSKTSKVECAGPIEVSHIRTAANSGTGLKPMDSSAVPKCRSHHILYHAMGHESFERYYGLDLAKLAAEFAARTPDEKLREVLRDSLPSGAIKLRGEG